MKRASSAGLTWFEPESLAPAGARAAFSTRLGGTSRGPYEFLNLALHVGDEEEAVIENRRRFWGAMGLDPAAPVGARQVHGARVAAVGAGDRGRGAHRWSEAFAAADGLVTLERGLPIFELAADCHLVALAAPDGAGCAALHAGWRGLLAGVIEEGARVLAENAGCSPSDLAAFAGPGLGEECFAVGEDFATGLSRAWGAPAAERLVRRGEDGSFFRYGAALLEGTRRAGIERENVELAGGCTACQPDLYYSHRASGGRTGRMALTVWMP